MTSTHAPRRTRFPARLAPALILLAALALAGCTDERYEAELASAAYTAPVRLTAPAPVVEAGALPAPSAAVAVGSARRIFSIGAPDGDERYLFGEIADVAVSSTGDTVYVLDRMSRRVKAFSREGRFLFHFGRQGKGPGEYQNPTSLALLPWSGQLVVWDLELQRLTFLTPAGETVRTVIPFRQNDYGRVGKKVRAWREGLVMEANDDPLIVQPENQRGFLVRLDTMGSVRDTVLNFAIPWIRGSGQIIGGEVASTTYLWGPYWTPDPEWDLLPDGEIAFAPGGRYEVFRFSVDGRARYRTVRPWTPERLTRAERVIYVAEAQKRYKWLTQLPAWSVETFTRGDFARLRPSITGIVRSADGGSVVRRFDAGDDPDGFSRTWDEYDRDGRPLRTLRFPSGFRPQLMTADRVYGLRRDTLDVDYLEAYRR